MTVLRHFSAQSLPAQTVSVRLSPGLFAVNPGVASAVAGYGREDGVPRVYPGRLAGMQAGREAMHPG